MPYVFGPVPSRRLGLSLGVDLIPTKTCTYDCLYCQVGRTTCKTVEPKPHVPVEEVLGEIRRKLQEEPPDTITLAGSGEPTLCSVIDRVIEAVKEMTDVPVALLTNGSLLWCPAVAERVIRADIVLPTLTSVFEETFRRIHRPHEDLHVVKIIEGMKRIRPRLLGRMYMEVVLLKGINDTDRELEGLKEAIAAIAPDRVQLNTVVRPPASSEAVALDRDRLEEIRAFLGPGAEIVADVPLRAPRTWETRAGRFLDMVKRRPLKGVDAEKALGISSVEVEELVSGLLLKGFIRKIVHSGTTFYVSNEESGG